ncbi:dihydrofolate reductase family protein [Halobacillus sp. H74]|uniref:dihydrofolate reductase family protein n=1 Tax=Halobacillus sp. H74 TaxID=3457436 RepID=UPI003FCDD997
MKISIWATGGAQLLHHFIDSELPDEYQIALDPTSVGNEVPLFQTTELEEELFLVDVKQIKDGKYMFTCILDGGNS